MKTRELDELMTKTMLVRNLRNRIESLIQSTWKSLAKGENKKILSGFVTQYMTLKRKMNEMHLDEKDVFDYDLRFKNLPWGNYRIPLIE